MGGLGDLDGLEFRDIADGDREEGKELREVLRLAGALLLPLELWEIEIASVVVVERCIAGLVPLASTSPLLMYEEGKTGNDMT